MSSSPPPRGRALPVIAVLVVVASAVVLWYITRQDGSGPPKPEPAPSSPSVKSPVLPQPPPVVLHESAAELSGLICKPGQPAEERIQYVEKAIYMYRQVMGGIPTGHNELVVNALLGENEKGAALLPKDCPAIVKGELVDEWGTPYWFHSVTSKDMEVRSAGPDRELFTDDDVVPDVKE
ncbi:type II secretion system protein GspG [Verrucomicrobium spinosum]|uniref:type II secretion system protein GspG n=1 Tax=Verrucomicrobium spinosum TaxID=2736 RepID=UPI000492538B|nr:type II secretion system protein GspG [Verrucomicrobium spinosum]